MQLMSIKSFKICRSLLNVNIKIPDERFSIESINSCILLWHLMQQTLFQKANLGIITIHIHISVFFGKQISKQLTEN